MYAVTKINNVRMSLSVRNIRSTDFVENSWLRIDSIMEAIKCNVVVDNETWHRRTRSWKNEGLIQRVQNPLNKLSESWKDTRLQFKRNRRTATGELIDRDICVPITPSTFDGGKYFQVILDGLFTF